LSLPVPFLCLVFARICSMLTPITLEVE
jgi:hypothetical protein